jgi:Domain of unknown function (DUF4398)
MRRTLLAAALSLGLGAAGCAHSPPAPVAQNDKLVESQAAIRAAEEMGAERVPQAARHLDYARQQVSDAERLLSEREYAAADLVLQQASADADLALALARAVPLQQEAQQLRERATAAQQGQQR